MDIVDALAKEGIHIDKKKIHIENPIKELGAFTVPIKLHPEITAELKVSVVKAYLLNNLNSKSKFQIILFMNLDFCYLNLFEI